MDPTLSREKKSQNTIVLLVDHFRDTTQPGWLNNYVVDDAARDQEVGGEDEGEDGPGRGSLKKRWTKELIEDVKKILT